MNNNYVQINTYSQKKHNHKICPHYKHHQSSNAKVAIYIDDDPLNIDTDIINNLIDEVISFNLEDNVNITSSKSSSKSINLKNAKPGRTLGKNLSQSLESLLDEINVISSQIIPLNNGQIKVIYNLDFGALSPQDANDALNIIVSLINKNSPIPLNGIEQSFSSSSFTSFNM